MCSEIELLTRDSTIKKEERSVKLHYSGFINETKGKGIVNKVSDTGYDDPLLSMMSTGWLKVSREFQHGQ
jgi:hypothetical protein